MARFPDPAPLDPTLGRWTDLPLPPYRFLPGVRDPDRPHPGEDPRGYLFGRREPTVRILPPDRWRDQVEYLYGVDLYHLAYWWEAHEAWEPLWRATADPVQRQYLHALIQTTAALLKRHVDRPRGADRLFRRARGKLAAVVDATPPGGRYMGLAVHDFHTRLLRAPRDDSVDLTLRLE